MDNPVRDQPAGGLEVFAEVSRIIVVGAHADDMETLAGGTLRLLAGRGVEIYELICTQGDLGAHDETYTRQSLAEARKQEAAGGASLLGVGEVVTLDYHDGELEPTLELRAAIAGYYRLWQPDALLTFDPSWAGQIHPDHRAAGRAAVDALMPARMPLYRPEQLMDRRTAEIKRVFFFSPASPSIFVDVSAVYEHKVAAALAHRSQFPEGDKSLDWMRELDSQAAKRSGAGMQYAEQFDELRLW
ncbi:MAG: PIG-L deacetylase family protein [Chloroflexia bacterium]